MSLDVFIGPHVEDEKHYLANSSRRNVPLNDVLGEVVEEYPDKEVQVDNRLRLAFAELREIKAW